MSNLPPELADLNAQYEQIFERYSTGQLTEEQARMTIENIVAVDGAGCTWRINPDPTGEEFLRAQPGGPFEPCNPMYFQPLTTPSASTAPRAPWETGTAGQPWSPQDASAGGFGADPFAGATFGRPQHQPDPAADTRGWAQQPATKPSRRERMASLSSGGFFGKLLADKRRLIGVAVIVIGVLLFVVSRSGGGGGGGGGGESASPTDPAVTAPVTPVVPTAPVAPTSPVDTPAPTEPAPTDPPAPAVLPVDGDVLRVAAALTSGQRETAISVLADQGSAHRQFMASATWAGLNAVGIDVRPEPVVVGEGAVVSQRWLLVDRATGTPVTAAVMTWVLDGTVWKLAAWPDLERLS